MTYKLVLPLLGVDIAECNPHKQKHVHFNIKIVFYR